MTLTIVHKIALLMRRPIHATADHHASQVRAQIVEDVFPLLPSVEQKAIADKTEYDEILGQVRAKFGDGYPETEYEAAARLIIEMIRDAERRVDGLPDPEPD